MNKPHLPDRPPGIPQDRHLAREWMTMGLYISISLLAAIGTIVETGNPEKSPLPTLWGVLIGLVIAHWFAFSLAAFATGTRDSRREDLLHVASGVAGAVSVGALITVTSILVPASWETAAITVVLIIYLALAAAVVARSRRAGWLRTIVIVAIVLALATAIIAVKNMIS